MTTASQGPTGFPRQARLLTATQFSRVFDGSEARASHKHLLLLAVTNTEPRHRLGLVIAKKNVRLAVQRNRVKRLAREFFRQLTISEPVPEHHLDVVLLARHGLDQLDNAALTALLDEQWQRLQHYLARNRAKRTAE